MSSSLPPLLGSPEPTAGSSLAEAESPSLCFTNEPQPWLHFAFPLLIFPFLKNVFAFIYLVAYTLFVRYSRSFQNKEEV